ncbi:BrnA antitoxin family protein [Massilia consociata]|uniref:BrnA antitoxin family protein n=1 Tax=Massilia consociata TaxID=760117 RepID=A0ABV6FD13_9BURK
MNKEYEPDWDQPVSRNEEPAVVSKPQMVNGVKQIVTIRLDVDMLEWFKAAGPGYQTRINQVLREHMDAQRAAAAAEEK